MDPDSNSLIIHLVILLVLILINAFFAMSEIAIVTFNDNKLKRMAEDGNKRAATLLSMVTEPSKFLSTIQIGVTLSGFLASASAAEQFADPFAQMLTPFMPYAAAESIALIVITLLLSYVSLVLGELVPKRIAMHHPERISLMVAPIIKLVFLISKPFVAVLSASTNLVLKLFRIDAQDKPEQVTEEEIRMMVDVGNEEGSIEKDEADMIDNIFEFDDITAEDVMTHRTDVAAVENTATVMDVITLAIKEGYSRIPVYEEDIDNIRGTLYVKDLLPYINHGNEFGWQQLVRKPYFVPEHKKINDLLGDFQSNKVHMAIVVDEYGSTLGLVSLEDIIEEIVGEISDESDADESFFTRLDEKSYLFDGKSHLGDFERVLGIDEETFADVKGDAETLAGLMLELKRDFPRKGDVFTSHDIRFTVQEMDGHRVDKIRVDLQ